MTDVAIKIERLLDSIEGRESRHEHDAVRQLHDLIGPAFPSYLLRKFRSAARWNVRTACIYHALKFARESDDAIELGIEAIKDRSKVVRYRGCMLLALSLNKSLLPFLHEMKDSVPEVSRADVCAAIDAIEHGNHHYFIDCDHSGRMKLKLLDYDGSPIFE